MTTLYSIQEKYQQLLNLAEQLDPEALKDSILSGSYGEKVTPVPIPNTVVKLLCANGSWGLPPARVGRCRAIYYSTVAQLVEQSAVNRSVAGSSPACGAIFLFERLCCRFSSVGRALPW